jgi:hypothetical protein
MMVPVARLPWAVDRTADQRTAGRADDQAGGAIVALQRRRPWPSYQVLPL